MKKIILSIVILLISSAQSLSHVEHYDKFNYLEYELYRNNKLIGYHKYDFFRKNDILSVKSKVEFKITKLGVDLYKYFAESDETYKELDKKLRRVESGRNFSRNNTWYDSRTTITNSEISIEHGTTMKLTYLYN